MENITKALLIAGGILFAILVLTLLVIFYNQMSSYYAEQNSAKMNEQVVEFNNKFENYNGQTIRGSELISIMNRVVDYNRTYADIRGSEKIIISIDLHEHQDDFLYSDTVSSNQIFKKSIITNSGGSDKDINKISELSSELVATTGIDDTKLQKLSSNIHIVCDNSNVDTRDEKLKQILGTTEKYDIKDIQNATIQYYQITQFKRAMFTCTEVVHSKKDEKISKISFEAVIENNKIKLN